EVLKEGGGIGVTHVAYRDVNSAMMGTVSGVVQTFVGVSTVAKAQIESGNVRGLAVTTAQRSALLPGLPTMVESGYPDFVMPGWGGYLPPARAPNATVPKLTARTARPARHPDCHARIA